MIQGNYHSTILEAMASNSRETQERGRTDSKSPMGREYSERKVGTSEGNYGRGTLSSGKSDTIG